MARTKPKYPWFLKVIQYISLVGLIALVLANAYTDHGVQMAINCIFLGFLVCAALVGKLIDRRIARIDEVFEDLKVAEAKAIAAAEKFETAVRNGYIEVIPTMPDDVRPPTRH